MTKDEFEQLLDNRIKQIKNTLVVKGHEYASSVDRLHNFKLAARINSTSPDIALWEMATKHLVSIIDMLNMEKVPSRKHINEKVGDLINYLILLEAVWEDMRKDINNNYEKENE